MLLIELNLWLLFLGMGILSGILAGLLGIGGGLVIVPMLIYIFQKLQMPTESITQMAVATSLTTIIFTSISSIMAHHKHRAIEWAVLPWIIPGVLMGGWFGVTIAIGISSEWLQNIFALFLLLVSFNLLSSKKMTPSKIKTDNINVFIWLPISSFIGGLSSLMGIGGGTLSVPFLHHQGLPLVKAIATSAVLGLPISLSGVISFISQEEPLNHLPLVVYGYIYWPAVVGILLTSLLFAPIGAALAHRMNIILLKRIFSILLFMVSMSLLW